MYEVAGPVIAAGPDIGMQIVIFFGSKEHVAEAFFALFVPLLLINAADMTVLIGADPELRRVVVFPGGIFDADHVDQFRHAVACDIPDGHRFRSILAVGTLFLFVVGISMLPVITQDLRTEHLQFLQIGRIGSFLIYLFPGLFFLLLLCRLYFLRLLFRFFGSRNVRNNFFRIRKKTASGHGKHGKNKQKCCQFLKFQILFLLQTGLRLLLLPNNDILEHYYILHSSYIYGNLVNSAQKDAWQHASARHPESFCCFLCAGNHLS